MQPPEELRDILSDIPDAILDVRYASNDNFTSQQLYNYQLAWLRREPLEKLVMAADELRQQGYRLVIFDAFRPQSVQKVLRQACSDDNYVAKISNHCRGITVDLTLSDEHGSYIDMGTDYDDFSEKAHVDSRSISQVQRFNRSQLAEIMQKYGFVQHPYEWWHFDYRSDKKWDLIDDELNSYV